MPLAHAGPRLRHGTPLASTSGDERLAEAVGRGDRNAFAAIYERYHQPLYRYCRSILRNDADAQDALQTAMVGAFVALQNGRRDAPLRPWLFRIAHNASISAMRRRHPAADLSSDGPGLESVEARAEERRSLELLVSDLGELPERQRGALVMRELSGLSHEEIALALGITVGAAKQSIFEARRSLLEFREGREIPCESIQRAISDRDGRVVRSRRMRAHLRECGACAAFAQAIQPRRAQLAALAPPLAPLAASGLLARLGAGHAGGAMAGAGAKSAALAVAVKTAAAIVVVAGATVAVTRTVHLGSASRPAAHSSVHAPGAAPGRTVRAPASAPRATRRIASAQAGAPRVAGGGRRTSGLSSAGSGGGVTVHWTTGPAPASGPSSHRNGASATQGAQAGGSAAAHDGAGAAHAKHATESAHGSAAQAHAKHAAASAHGNSAQAHAKHATTPAHGNSAQAHAKHATSSASAPGNSASGQHKPTGATGATGATGTSTSTTAPGNSAQGNGNSGHGQGNPNAGSTAANGPAPPGLTDPGRHTS